MTRRLSKSGSSLEQTEAFELDELRLGTRGENQATDELLARSARERLRVEAELAAEGWLLELLRGRWRAVRGEEVVEAASPTAVLRRLREPSPTPTQTDLFADPCLLPDRNP